MFVGSLGEDREGCGGALETANCLEYPQHRPGRVTAAVPAKCQLPNDITKGQTLSLNN